MIPRASRSWFVALALAGSALANPLVVGHRGAGSSDSSNPYPENTVPAIVAGFEQGADLVEIDVQLAAGGELVLWHDEHLDVDGRRQRVSDTELVDFPVLQGPTGIVAEVPSFGQALEAALDAAPGAKVLDIEIKVYDDADREPLVQALAQTLRDQRASRRVMISSFDLGLLVRLEDELPGVETGLLGVLSNRTLKKVKRANAAGAQIEWVIPSTYFSGWPLNLLRAPEQGAPADAGQPSEVAAERAEDEAVAGAPAGSSDPMQVKGWFDSFVEKAHAAGVRVGVWTPNGQKAIAKYVSKGYDMIITDDPDVARGIVGWGMSAD